MTRDEIIRMAEEAKIPCVVTEAAELERFAELVAAAEREKLNKKIAALEADVDHFFRLSGKYLERANKAEEAVAAERERCANFCESYAYSTPLEPNNTALGLAAAIRGMK